MATAQDIMFCRYELADTDPAFPVLTDSEYSYFVDKHLGNLQKAMLDAAKTILFKLSMKPDEIVDVMSVKNSNAAVNYREALLMYINKTPNLRPAYYLSEAYAGGISKSDMLSNDSNSDNNSVLSVSISTENIKGLDFTF